MYFSLFTIRYVAEDIVVIWMRVAVVGERRSDVDLRDMSTVGLFTGFEGDGMESLELLVVGCADDRPVGWSEDDLADSDLGEFLDDEFCFVSTVGEGDQGDYGL